MIYKDYRRRKDTAESINCLRVLLVSEKYEVIGVQISYAFKYITVILQEKGIEIEYILQFDYSMPLLSFISTYADLILKKEKENGNRKFD